MWAVAIQQVKQQLSFHSMSYEMLDKLPLKKHLIRPTTTA